MVKRKKERVGQHIALNTRPSEDYLYRGSKIHIEHLRIA